MVSQGRGVNNKQTNGIRTHKACNSNTDGALKQTSPNSLTCLNHLNPELCNDPPAPSNSTLPSFEYLEPKAHIAKTTLANPGSEWWSPEERALSIVGRCRRGM